MYFTDKIMADKNFTLQFIAATNTDGQPFYVYLLLMQNKLQDLSRKLKSGKPIDLYKQGQIIASGLGHQPSDEVKAEIKQIFGKITKKLET